MTQALQKPATQKKLFWLILLVFSATLLLLIAAIGFSGGNLIGGALYYGATLLIIWFPGLLLCDLLMPTLQTTAKPVVAFTLGSVCLVTSFAALGSFLPVIFSALPNTIAGCYWVFRSLRRKSFSFPKQISFSSSLLLLLCAIVTFLVIFTGIFPSARPATLGNMVYDQDMLWSAGSAASVWYGFPVRDLRTAGGLFHYHYFSDAVAGLIAAFTGQTSWDANFFFMRPLWPCLILLGTYSASRRLGAGEYQALIPAMGVTLFLFHFKEILVHLYLNPNNVNQHYVFLMGTILVLLQAEKEGFSNNRHIPILVISLTSLIWSKGSTGVLFLFAMGAALIVSFFTTRKFNLQILLTLAVTGLITWVLFTTIFSKANINLFFGPSWPATLAILKEMSLQYTPAFLLYLVSVGLSLRFFPKLTFVQLTLHAMVAGGILAGCLYDHYGAAERYFPLIAYFLMWLCIAPHLPRILTKKSGQFLVTLCCTAGFVGNLITLTPLLRHGAQASLRIANLRPAFPVEYNSLTADDDSAALWLRANMTREDVFSTNRNERSLETKDGVFHGYTALSGRQAFVEGWYYAMEYSMDYNQLRHNLEAVSDGIYACETYEEAAAIARANGITYILVHLPTRGSAFVGGTPAFASETVLIYSVT